MTFSWPRFRTPPIAIRNVIHGGRRSLAAISGVAFALTMVLLQLGFLEAVRITATNPFEQLDFDVILLSPRYEQFYAAGPFPRERLNQALGISTVTHAAPLYGRFGLWRCPPYPLDNPPSDLSAPSAGALARWLLGGRAPRPLQRRELFVLGVDLDRNPFSEPIRARIEAAREQLRLPGRILLNERSHPDFGWELRDRVKDWELAGRAVVIVGGFEMLRGFAADAAVICSDQNFALLCGPPAPEQIHYGLLKIRSGTLEETLHRLRDSLPPDVQALSRAEILARETDHWVNQTSTGRLFASGVVVAMIVAAVVVYQVLSNDVRDHLAEYATLKAIGYSQLRLAEVVVVQALIYVAAAYLAGLGIGAIAYQLTEQLAGIPMRLTSANLGLALVLAIAVGLLSGLLTVDRLRAARPADLF